MYIKYLSIYVYIDVGCRSVGCCRSCRSEGIFLVLGTDLQKIGKKGQKVPL